MARTKKHKPASRVTRTAEVIPSEHLTSLDNRGSAESDTPKSAHIDHQAQRGSTATNKVPNLFWKAAQREDLCRVPRFISLPHESDIQVTCPHSFRILPLGFPDLVAATQSVTPQSEPISSSCYCYGVMKRGFIRQGSITWSLLHSGVLTTGCLSDLLGFKEQEAATILHSPSGMIGHGSLLAACHRLREAPHEMWSTKTCAAMSSETTLEGGSHACMSMGGSHIYNTQLVSSYVKTNHKNIGGSTASGDHSPLVAGGQQQQHGKQQQLRYEYSVSIARRGQQAVRCAWGSVQEGAALLALTRLLPDSTVHEVGLMVPSASNLPTTPSGGTFSWPLAPVLESDSNTSVTSTKQASDLFNFPGAVLPLPLMGASPDGIICHKVSGIPKDQAESILTMLATMSETKNSNEHLQHSLLSRYTQPTPASTRINQHHGSSQRILGIKFNLMRELEGLLSKVKICTGQEYGGGGDDFKMCGQATHKESASDIIDINKSNNVTAISLSEESQEETEPWGSLSEGFKETKDRSSGEPQPSEAHVAAAAAIGAGLVPFGLGPAAGVQIGYLPLMAQSRPGDTTLDVSDAPSISIEPKCTNRHDQLTAAPAGSAVQTTSVLAQWLESAVQLVGLKQDPVRALQIQSDCKGGGVPGDTNGNISGKKDSEVRTLLIREVIEIKSTCPFACLERRSGARGKGTRTEWIISDRGPRDSVAPAWVPQLQMHMLASGCLSALLVSRSATKGIKVFRMYYDEEYVSRMLALVSKIFSSYCCASSVGITGKDNPSQQKAPPVNMLIKDAEYRAFLYHTLRLARHARLVAAVGGGPGGCSGNGSGINSPLGSSDMRAFL